MIDDMIRRWEQDVHKITPIASRQRVATHVRRECPSWTLEGG